MKLSYAIGGLAGACALTLINQGVAQLDKKAPRLDLLGMNAVAKIFNSPKTAPPLVRTLFPVAVTGDLVSNSLYYSLAGSHNKNTTLLKGLLLGLGAGMGAVSLPKAVGIDESPTNYADRTKLMTIAWYILGGLVAAATINAMEDKDLADKLSLPQ